MKRNQRREQRQSEAKTRNERWAAMSPEEQLAHLDKHGLRALRQRAKIQAKIKSN